MKKPIVIAGNGPSLANIDYCRLPAEFDVFRCNQFYFEDKYFLGRHVTGAFMNANFIKEQYFTLKMLQQRREYTIDQIYLVPHHDWEEEQQFPMIKNTLALLKTLPQFYELSCFIETYYQQWLTTGIHMLISSIALGYREIYLTGLDFYDGGGTDYAFQADKPHAVRLMPRLTQPNLENTWHSKEIDLMCLKMAQEISDVKLFRLNEAGVLKDYVDLAPIVNQYSKKLEIKNADAFTDFVPLPLYNEGKILKLSRFLGVEFEYQTLKETFYYHILKSVWIVVKTGTYRFFRDSWIVLKVGSSMLGKLILNFFRKSSK